MKIRQTITKNRVRLTLMKENFVMFEEEHDETIPSLIDLEIHHRFRYQKKQSDSNRIALELVDQRHH